MTVYALDTNIISAMLKHDEQIRSCLKNISLNNDSCIIPPVVYHEIKRGLIYINSTVKFSYFEKLCNKFSVGDMTLDMWDEASRVYAVQRRKGLSIDDADLFIAAFCLVGKHPLVTNNMKHFEHIEGLTCLNWKS
jgi:predicted nucleic acid-binding protein